MSLLTCALVLALTGAFAGAQGTPQVTVPDTHLISKYGIGRIRLGMTLDEARTAVPAAKFSRTSDGDGAALVEVSLAAGESLILSAGEDDPAAPVDWTKRIRVIETFSPAFRTAEGVQPGSLVTHVETIFGKTRMIKLSEIESRQYIAFEAQPEYLTFRLDYTGIFPARARTTNRFAPGAKILSIGVSSH